MTDTDSKSSESHEEDEIDSLVKKYAKSKQLKALAIKHETKPVKELKEPKKPVRYKQRRTSEEIDEAVKNDKNPLKITSRKEPEAKVRTTTKLKEIVDETPAPIIIKRKKSLKSFTSPMTAKQKPTLFM